MAKQVALAAAHRTGSGKSEARKLRREGRIPAVAYGRDLDATPVSVDQKDLFHALHTDAGMNVILRLNIEGDTHLAIPREPQRHPVRREMLHVDFVTVSRDVKITVDVPINLSGEAPGVNEGGVADQDLYTLQVEVLPLEVPDEIVLDISDMQIGDVKRVSDLDLPTGVEPLDDPERTVVSVYVPQVEVPEPEAAEEELAEAVAGEEPEAADEAAQAEAEPAGEDDEA